MRRRRTLSKGRNVLGGGDWRGVGREEILPAKGGAGAAVQTKIKAFNCRKGGNQKGGDVQNPGDVPTDTRRAKTDQRRGGEPVKPRNLVYNGKKWAKKKHVDRSPGRRGDVSWSGGRGWPKTE